MDMLRLFYDCDEFCREFLPRLPTYQIPAGTGPRPGESRLSVSEVMTILLLFQTSGFRTLKTFYLQHVCRYLPRAFAHLVSYSRFVELEAQALLPLAAFLTTRLGRCTGLVTARKGSARLSARWFGDRQRATYARRNTAARD